jgi:zinc/manganese transport system substrate-binding protein
VLLTLSSACASGGPGSAPAGGRLAVVAAENVWGSIAAQLGGDFVTVKSIIENPDADPHDYEPTASDARAVASARYAIYNGVGYDPWAPRLLAASPRSGRGVLDVGALVHVAAGGNPHRWYAPSDVARVIDRITADYIRLAPAHAADFTRLHDAYVNTGLAHYHALIDEIRVKYASTPVGASESIFAPLADALGLKLLTPESFLDAISEGSEPTAADKSTADEQIRARQIRVYVFNRQNATPDVRAEVDAARAAGIPVTSITETLEPANATFQDWQVSELQALEGALARAATSAPVTPTT